jgi:hypothetical protein
MKHVEFIIFYSVFDHLSVGNNRDLLYRFQILLALDQDPNPGSSAFLIPGAGMAKIRIRDKQSGKYFRQLINNGLKTLEFFVADPNPRYCDIFTLDPGFGIENSGTWDKHPGSAASATRKFLLNVHQKMLLTQNKVKNIF